MAKVWGYEYRDETHYLRLYINYLRKKIEEDPANPRECFEMTVEIFDLADRLQTPMFLLSDLDIDDGSAR